MTELSLEHHAVAARHGDDPHPALVLLHGMGSNEQDMLVLAQYIDPRAFVVSARAPFVHRYGGYSWYDLEQHGPALGSESIEDALGRLDRFLGEILVTYPIDAQQLYLGGFSMGAAMSAAMTLLHPDRIAGAILVSGFLPPDIGERYRTTEARGLPVFQGTGTNDPLVRLEYAHLTRDYLSNAGVDLTYREYPIGHEVALQELQDIRVWFDGVLAGEKTPIRE